MTANQTTWQQLTSAEPGRPPQPAEDAWAAPSTMPRASPPPPAWVPPTGPQASEPKRRSKWWWLLLAVGLIPVGVLAYGFHEACCTHDLLEADFNTDAGPFLTGENEGFRADLDRGTYRVTAKTDSPALAWVFAWLARPTTTVLTELTVTEPGSGDVGVACLDEGAAVAERGFVFIIGDGEASLVDLQAWDRSDPQPTGTQLRTERERATLTRTTTAPLQGGQRIGISCALGDLEAYLDGELVLTASYRGGGGTRFNRSAFYFDPAHAGDAARFDDVDAHLP